MSHCIPCKIIIDSGAALIQQLSCLNASILLGASSQGPEPEAESVAEFKDAAERLAKIAAKIERQVSRG